MHDSRRFGLTRRLAVACLAALLMVVVWAPHSEAAFPGKPGEIAFTRMSAVVKMPATGGAATLISTGRDPFFSGDGKLIAYEDLIPGNNFDILTMDPFGGNKLNISNHPNDEFDGTISRDGKRVAFARQVGNFDIYVREQDGTIVNLTNTAQDEFDPSFARDGRIAFTRFTPDAEVFVMDGDGSNPVNVTNSGGTTDYEPNFSPDGRRITYTRTINMIDSIWLMEDDGRNPTALTNGLQDDNAPAFAPDASAIAFGRDTNANGFADEIFSVEPDGSSLTNLTNTGAGDVDGEPNWQPIPVKCGGKRSTLVGTAGKDTLVGTKMRDVIAGLGAKDKIRGLSRGDRLCGGGGNDRILGGGGNDRILGGKGSDTCVGGPGRRDDESSC